MGPKRGFLWYPMGHSQGTCFDVGDSEVLRSFNLNPHHHLTFCSSDCTMYAYIEVYFIIYFRGTNILYLFKKKNALIKVRWCRFCVGVSHRWPLMMANPWPYIRSSYLGHGFRANKCTATFVMFTKNYPRLRGIWSPGIFVHVELWLCQNHWENIVAVLNLVITFWVASLNTKPSLHFQVAIKW